MEKTDFQQDERILWLKFALHPASPRPEIRDWADADEETLREYVKKQFPDAVESSKHIKFPIFEDTPVDMHDTPLKLFHPGLNRRLQQWLEENKAAQMAHTVRLAGTDADIAVPTAAFWRT